MRYRGNGPGGHRCLIWMLISILAWSGLGRAAAATAGEASTTSAPVNSARSVSGKPHKPANAHTIVLHQEVAYYGATLKHGIPISGTAKRSIVRQDDNTWEYRFDVDSFFADIHEWVKFRYNGQQVIPERYHYKLTGWAVPDRGTDLSFNWQKGQVTDLNAHKIWPVKLHPGVMDKLGSQLQLRQDIKAGKKDLHYAVAEDGKLEDYHFAVVGPEKLDTRKLGKINTVRVREVRPPSKKRKTILWFAPKWDYLLVKLLQVEPDGTRYEIFLDHALVRGQRIGDWSHSKGDETLPLKSKH